MQEKQKQKPFGGLKICGDGFETDKERGKLKNVLTIPRSEATSEMHALLTQKEKGNLEFWRNSRLWHLQ